MKKKKSQNLMHRYTFLILISGISLLGEANDNAKMSKTISRDFKVDRTTTLEVSNKYGDLILNSWDQDSVQVIVTITAFGKNEEAAKDLLKRTVIEFDQTGNYLKLNTQLNKSSSWVRELWNELSDYSKSILSKDQLDINYQIYLPDYLKVDLSNKYGDVFMEHRTGETRLNLSNGSLKADRLTGKTILDLSFCEADINAINQAEIIIKSGELDLNRAENLTLKSSSSEIVAREVGKLFIVSRTDKLRVNQLGSLQGQGSFSKIHIRSFHGPLNMEMNYGSIIADNIKSGFSEIQVTGKSTDINFKFEHNVYFSARIIGKEGKVDLPAGHQLKQVYTDGREKYVQATGFLGILNSNPATLDINAEGGKVAIEFAHPDASSQNNKN